MKFKIYCIIDINGLKYVGKTYKTLKERLRRHRNDKNINNGCSSEKLDLDNCEIILLCECDECEAKYREQYFKDNIKCVNKNNMVFDVKQYHKKYSKNYYIDNKDKLKQQHNEWISKNKNKRKQYHKERYLFNSSKVVNGSYDFIKMLEQY